MWMLNEAFVGLCFENPLRLATQELYFMFKNILYKQNDGAAIGSRLGPTIANLFLSIYDIK